MVATRRYETRVRPGRSLQPSRAPALLPLVLSACASAGVSGPMPVRNQHPAQLLVMAQPPRSAAALPPGTVESALAADYSSLFLGERTPARTFVMDGEVLRTTLSARVGVVPGVDLEVAVPVVHASAGFLDSFVLDYHRAFGLPQSGRSETSKGLYTVQASQNGDVGFGLVEHGLHLADVPLLAHVVVLDEGPRQPGVALRGGIEFPTGSAHDGTGNGRLDGSLGAEAEWHVWGDLGLSLGAFHTFTGGSGPAAHAGFDLQDVTGVHSGFELPVLASWSLLLQTTFETSTLRALPLRRTDRPQWLVWLGTRIGLFAGLACEASFSEDLLPDISPDFSARAALVVHLPVRPETR